ncbi:hypothetical protein N806_03560 [Rhodococcus sp. P27]|nr:hypothetical protein N806_03560 [Rhodococcus sp. P27]
MTVPVVPVFETSSLVTSSRRLIWSSLVMT